MLGPLEEHNNDININLWKSARACWIRAGSSNPTGPLGVSGLESPLCSHPPSSPSGRGLPLPEGEEGG
eukprot:7651814-Pyramimonas_sp.AAC.1